VAFEDVGGTFPSPEVNLPATSRMDVPESPDLDRGHRGVRRDDFLSRVERICRLREPGLVEAQPQQAGAPSVDYLRVTVKQDSVVLEYPVGVSEHGIDAQVLERFLTVHRRYRETDPGVVSWLVYGSAPRSAAITGRRGSLHTAVQPRLPHLPRGFLTI
jgi:hypothetical protein